MRIVYRIAALWRALFRSARIYRQWTQNRGALVVRTAMDPRSLFTPVIRAVHSVDAEQPLYDVRTMTDVVERSQAPSVA